MKGASETQRARPDDDGTVVLEAVEVSKAFGHVQALKGASLAVRSGEILALVGDNGAGKSTLVKVLSGAMKPDSGSVRLLNETVPLTSIEHAIELGVSMVYQDLALCPDLSVAENIFLGREVLRSGWKGRLGILDRKSMLREASEGMGALGLNPGLNNVTVQALSGGQRQGVAIARTVKYATRAIIMDEPTAALGPKQTAIVYSVIKAAAQSGLGVIIISHDIPHMLEFAHQIAVMRHGSVVSRLEARKTSVGAVVEIMVGGDGQPDSQSAPRTPA